MRPGSVQRRKECNYEGVGCAKRVGCVDCRMRYGAWEFFVMFVFNLSARESKEERETYIHRGERNCVVIDGRMGGLCRFMYWYNPVSTAS